MIQTIFIILNIQKKESECAIDAVDVVHFKPLILITYKCDKLLPTAHRYTHLFTNVSSTSLALDHMGFYFERISSSPPCVLFYVVTICIYDLNTILLGEWKVFCLCVCPPLAMSLSPNSHSISTATYKLILILPSNMHACMVYHLIT